MASHHKRNPTLSDRKLQAWQAAGLIDAATVQRITAYEAANARPMGLWALVAIGALAIGLGLVSLIAANWDAIPGLVRLGVHFAALAGFAAWLALRWRGWPGAKPDEDAASEGWGALFHDALLFILAAMGLTFFGHIGQVYQTSSPLWQPLALWLLLFTPVLLGFGRGWLAALLWMIGLMGTAGALLSWFAETSGNPPALLAGFVAGLPALTLAGAAWLRGATIRDDFWRRVEQISIAMVVEHACWLLIIASVGALFGSGGGDGNGDLVTISFIYALLCAFGALGLYTTIKGRGGLARAAVLLACGITALMASAIGGSSSLLQGLLFMALWAAIAWAALYAEWRGVFQIAVGVLALRLIILSFELATDLLGSGVGLILAGLFTLGVAFGAVRVSRRYAPDKRKEAGV